MPKLYDLASEKLNVGGAQGQLRPVTFSGAAAGGIRAGRINPHAGDIKFTPLPVPGYVVDTTVTAAANMASTWASAAYKFQEAEALLKADSAVLKAEDQLNQLYYGNGEDIEGYANMLGERGSEGFSDFSQQVVAATEEALAGQEGRVQAKMALRLNQMQNNFLESGAKHKAKEFRTWQGVQLQANEDATKQRILTESQDPEKFIGSVAKHMDTIAKQYAGRDDFIAVKQEQFKNEILNDVISFHTNTSNFEAADAYIQIAKNNGGDPAMLAVKHKQLGIAIEQFTAKQERLDNNAAKKAEKEQKLLATNSLIQAMNTNDPRHLDSITDPYIKEKAQGTYKKLQEFSVTDPEAHLRMRLQRDQLSANPELVLDTSLWPGVSGEDRIEFYNQLVNDQKSGMTNLRKDYERWTSSLLPQPSSFTYKFESKEAEATNDRILRMFDFAVRDARKNGTDPESAVMATKSKIMTDPAFDKTYNRMTVAKESLRPIDGLLNGGMMGLDKNLEIMSLSEGNTLGQAVEWSYEDASLALLDKYGVNTPDQLVKDPQIYNQYMRDAVALSTQYRYYKQVGGEPEPQKPREYTPPAPKNDSLIPEGA